MVDTRLQRINMVESQVRPNDVTDRRITRAMLEVPREAFVPSAMKPLAYMEGEVEMAPARDGLPRRMLLAPRTFAQMVQLAELEPSAVVLDIGCGLGYSAAVLARIAETVVALESDPVLAEEAARAIEAQSLDNVAVVTGELDVGYPSEGPYDAILIEGAVADVPAHLLDQLKDGGRLVAVIADQPVGHLTVWRRHGEAYDRRVAFTAGAPRLPGFARRAEFVF